MRRTIATARAPASVANLAVGFDLLGHSIDGPADRVTARRTEAPGVRIATIEGTPRPLPREAVHNTAGRAVLAWLEATAPGFGIELQIHKGIPLSSGLGGSAASAVAAVVAANALLAAPLPTEALYRFALEGEAVASGAAHGDNVGPALVGGLVIAARDRLVRVPVPAGLTCVGGHPDLAVETRAARAVLRAPFELADVVEQTRNLALVLGACHGGDLDAIGAALRDVLVEPRRAPLIPGFAEVQRAALSAGALGSSISGGGPSVFAWCRDRASAARAGTAMARAFEAAGLSSTVHVSAVAGPAASLVEDDS